MSSKNSVQPGRRTPLSLSGAVIKTQPNKGTNSIPNGSGINANGHAAPSNTKQQDNKLQPPKGDQPTVNNSEAKENPIKKQQPQAEKKQPEGKKSNEKTQNGIDSSNKQEKKENKQQQQSKEKVEQQNGNDVNKVNEREKPDKSEKPKDKPEKDITKSKEDKTKDQVVPQNKKEEKKTKESKDTKEDKKDISSKGDANNELHQHVKGDNNKSNDGNKEKDNCNDKKTEENMGRAEDQAVEKSSNNATPKGSSKANRTSTPVDKTPSKTAEKSAQKSTPTHKDKKTPVFKREETTAIDDNDVEMEPLTIDNSPVKPSQPEESANIKIVPSATSTPGKLLGSKRNSGAQKSDVHLAMQTERSPSRPRMFSQISGRKTIRPISDYTPSKFQSNLQFRESYRRINTELDVTNTSMNVTVGSEAPSNFSFSFFGRGRKRDRVSPPPHSQSAIGELQTDVEISPPKKARLDIHGILSAVSSPISLLRNRFSKASLQSSTPFKLQQNLISDEDEIEVQNVSGVSVHEEITTPDKGPAEFHSTTDGNDATLGEEAKETKLSSPNDFHSVEKEFKEVSYDSEESFDQADSKITESPLQSAVGDQMAKNKKCAVM